MYLIVQIFQDNFYQQKIGCLIIITLYNNIVLEVNTNYCVIK